MGYDPAFLNTASCRSSITFIDGDKGILRYRGYRRRGPGREVERSSRCAYLILNGELPSKEGLEKFTKEVTTHTFLHENMRTFIDGFRYDAHPMGVLIGSVGALSTFYPESKDVKRRGKSPCSRSRASSRRCPTIAAWSYRHSLGYPVRLPGQQHSASQRNLLAMMQEDGRAEVRRRSSHRARARRALHPSRRPRAELLHGVGSRGRQLARRPLLCRRCGRRGALRPAARRRQRGRSPHARRDRLASKTSRPSSRRSSRARAKSASWALATACTRTMTRARRSSRSSPTTSSRSRVGTRSSTSRSSSRSIALNDEYFVKRKLYPNVDFLLGPHLPGHRLSRWTCSPCSSRFPRTAGWLAQWEEMLLDEEQKIARPRQIYTGHDGAQVRRRWTQRKKSALLHGLAEASWAAKLSAAFIDGAVLKCAAPSILRGARRHGVALSPIELFNDGRQSRSIDAALIARDDRALRAAPKCRPTFYRVAAAAAAPHAQGREASSPPRAQVDRRRHGRARIVPSLPAMRVTTHGCRTRVIMRRARSTMLLARRRLRKHYDRVLCTGTQGGNFFVEERAFQARWLYELGADVALFTLPFHGQRDAIGMRRRGRRRTRGAPSEGFGQTIYRSAGARTLPALRGPKRTDAARRRDRHEPRRLCRCAVGHHRPPRLPRRRSFPVASWSEMMWSHGEGRADRARAERDGVDTRALVSAR